MAVEMYANDRDPNLARVIRGEIAELDALVGEILLSSRLDHGADADPGEPVDCLALAAEEAARAGVILRAVATAAPPFEVMGSPRLLRRLIRNLVENALKHGAPPVEVALAHASLAGAPAISISVYDRGPGIPENLRERVFEPFFRPAGWTEEAGGWGLGLSLVRQIARRHGGVVRVEAEGGVTRFAVDLPNAKGSRSAPI
jgi:signal transduction histidine kinase